MPDNPFITSSARPSCDQRRRLGAYSLSTAVSGALFHALQNGWQGETGAIMGALKVTDDAP